MTDITWTDRTDAGTPTGAASEVSAAIMNEIKTTVNSKLDETGGTLTGELSFSGTSHAGLKVLSLTSTQRDALTAAVGMVIYNSTVDQLQVRTSSAWVDLTDSTITDLLASIQNGEGASMIGVEDSAGNFTGATVEAVLTQIATDYVEIEDIAPPDGKSVPVTADGFLIIDSEDSDELKTTTIAEFFAVLASLLDAKTTPVVGDSLIVFDSAASSVPKETTFTQVISTFGLVRGGTTSALTVGYTTSTFDAGTKSSGTFTPDPASGHIQKCVNGGAFTLAPDTDGHSLRLKITNNASAGAITTSGFDVVTGDSFTTTNTHKFICYISNDGDGDSHLHVVAMQ